MVKVVAHSYGYKHYACDTCGHEYGEHEDAKGCEAGHAKSAGLLIGQTVEFQQSLGEGYERTLAGEVVAVNQKKRNGALVELKDRTRLWIRWSGYFRRWESQRPGGSSS